MRKYIVLGNLHKVDIFGHKRTRFGSEEFSSISKRLKEFPNKLYGDWFDDIQRHVGNSYLFFIHMKRRNSNGKLSGQFHSGNRKRTYETGSVLR